MSNFVTSGKSGIGFFSFSAAASLILSYSAGDREDILTLTSSTWSSYSLSLSVSSLVSDKNSPIAGIMSSSSGRVPSELGRS